ncbi:MAG: 8-oxo-dGTP diphosphatase [Candidatus Pacebacteria bacterium]|nr:8-oxo-dGTP diphosphatase [Candidatus Paceibacterota bacterium]
MKKLLTLCLVHQHPNILLGFKKRGFGANRWNGFGGKVQEGETIEEATRREVMEEAGLALKDLELRGILEFHVQDDPDFLEVYLFRSENFEGEPQESEEMLPQWFHYEQLPFQDMWPDDQHWMPLFLEGKKFKGRFLFDPDNNILEKALEIVEDL